MPQAGTCFYSLTLASDRSSLLLDAFAGAPSSASCAEGGVFPLSNSKSFNFQFFASALRPSLSLTLNYQLSSRSPQHRSVAFH